MNPLTRSSTANGARSKSAWPDPDSTSARDRAITRVRNEERGVGRKTRRRGDKGTRGQGDKDFPSPCLLVPLSPCLLPPIPHSPNNRCLTRSQRVTYSFRKLS